MTNLRADTVRYNAIPERLLSAGRRIFELGARYGEAQLASKHREAFLIANREGRYLGVDVLAREPKQLEILRGDFLTLTSDRLGGPYDTIIMCEVVEHICIRDWQKLFIRLKTLLREGGVLIMTTPYRESIKKLSMYRLHDEPYGGHVVYEITPTLIQQYLPGLKWKRLKLHYPFRSSGESWLRAFARFAKRVVTRHPLAWKWSRLEVDALVIVWTKQEQDPERDFEGETEHKDLLATEPVFGVDYSELARGDWGFGEVKREPLGEKKQNDENKEDQEGK